MTPATCPCGDYLRPGAAACQVCGRSASGPGPTCMVCGVRLVPPARGRWPQYCASHRIECRREYHRRPEVAERQREYQREYSRRAEVAERKRERQREYRRRLQQPEARPPDADPIREVLIRITEEMPAFSRPHQWAKAALESYAPATARQTLEAVLGALHPASPVRGLIENTRS